MPSKKPRLNNNNVYADKNGVNTVDYKQSSLFGNVFCDDDDRRYKMESDDFPSINIGGNIHGKECVIGIDEAGRGPVVGPLVYSLFIAPKSKLLWLKKHGANDSKLLTHEHRTAFFLSIKEEHLDEFGWITKVIHPERISNCMLKSKKLNLNELSFQTVFSLIKKSLFGYKINITQAFVDTLGTAEKYQERLSLLFPTIEFTVKSKADSIYPIVGAASITAKVIRDNIIEQLGIEASGYPGDSLTVKWLHQNYDHVFGFPNVVRFSWSSCNDLLTKKCCTVIWKEQ